MGEKISICFLSVIIENEKERAEATRVSSASFCCCSAYFSSENDERKQYKNAKKEVGTWASGLMMTFLMSEIGTVFSRSITRKSFFGFNQ
jgi:hypothetical protein